MRSASVRPRAGDPLIWRSPVLRVLVLAAVGTVASFTAGAVVAARASLDASEPIGAEARVREDLARIHGDVRDHRARTGRWPGGLGELYGQAPVDPWGRPYVYLPAGGARLVPDVVSFGGDRWPGGTGAAADRWMSTVYGPPLPEAPETAQRT